MTKTRGVIFLVGIALLGLIGSSVLNISFLMTISKICFFGILVILGVALYQKVFK